jgi:hypothetical protein
MDASCNMPLGSPSARLAGAQAASGQASEAACNSPPSRQSKNHPKPAQPLARLGNWRLIDERVDGV